ncbi:MAG TPA: DUF4124 domain-containing protein [Steroidobacteraceae bacterium]|jgi:hypothetical protein
MPRSTVILLATSMVVLLGAIGVARADTVYEWTDAKGEVHYTDQWVPGAKLIRSDATHRPKTESGAAQGIQSESNAASQGLQQQAQAQAVQQDVAKARAERCSQDKAQYQSMTQSRRIYTTDKKGDRQYLSDSDADAARLKARQAMDADCGTGSAP